MSAFLEYSEERHAYYVDGREVPSVTTVLKHAGLISPYSMDAVAAWRGSEVHRYCALNDLEKWPLTKVPKAFRGYIKAWRSYRHMSGFNPTRVEERIDAHDYSYAGRFDRYGYRGLSKVPVIIDIKTGPIAGWVKYQLVAYAAAMTSNPQNVCERAAVTIRPDGDFRVQTWPITEFYKDLGDFRRMLADYNNRRDDHE